LSHTSSPLCFEDGNLINYLPWLAFVETGLWELDISKVRCSSTVFPKMFL
jgi:hypothetical protein